MSKFTGSLGDTFFGKDSGPGTPKEPHLHVIASEQFDENKIVVVVTVTSFAPMKDRTTRLEVYDGQHDYISKPSLIDYEHAAVLPVHKIQQKLHSGEWRYNLSKFPESDLRNIINGVLASNRTPPEIKSFLLAQHHKRHQHK